MAAKIQKNNMFFLRSQIVNFFTAKNDAKSAESTLFWIKKSESLSCFFRGVFLTL
jgi:hypothetical protein